MKNYNRFKKLKLNYKKEKRRNRRQKKKEKKIHRTAKAQGRDRDL